MKSELYISSNKETHKRTLARGRVMVKYRILLMIVIPFITMSNIYSQSIYKNWISDTGDICLHFDSVLNCISINKLYDVEECQRIKFKKVNQNIKIKIFVNQTFWGWQKEFYTLHIENLTQNRLSLIIRERGNKNVILHSLFKNNSIKFNSISTCR